MNKTAEHSLLIKNAAREAGFDIVAIAKAEELDMPFVHYKEWIDKGYHGTMSYLTNNQEKRQDVRNILPQAASVIVLGLSYQTPHSHINNSQEGKISRYAWGTDYHEILPEKLEAIVSAIHKINPESQSKYYVDTGPVLEKQWAVKSGLGWQGKHSNIISREIGSWFFLGVIITTLECLPDEPIQDFCGSCTACLDACPTQAIVQPYVVDGTKCLSYWTIETKPDIEIPLSISENQENWIFGCDICQEVCPWNKFEKLTSISEFYPREHQTSLDLQAVLTMQQEEFSARFKKSPIKRTKLAGLQRNSRSLLSD